jgi:hypothetical protein
VVVPLKLTGFFFNGSIAGKKGKPKGFLFL